LTGNAKKKKEKEKEKKLEPARIKPTFPALENLKTLSRAVVPKQTAQCIIIIE